MSASPNYMQSLLQLYKGSQQGGTQGAQNILAGLSGGSKLVGSSAIAPDYQSQLGSASNTLGGGANALGIYNGIQQGGVTGYGGAAINAANLAGRSGALPTDVAKPVGGVANDLSSALGIYSGIKQGGVAGDTSAAINAAKLGSNLGAFGNASGAVGAAAGYAAVPLSIYNEIQNWQSGATGSDALSGAETGAAIGSVVPGIGTAIGALIGGAAGALSSVFGNGRVDPENQNFEQYTQAYNKAASSDPSQASQLAGSVQNPYLPLAGYFDLRANQMKGSNPIYQTYGRMGEQQFTTDLAGLVNRNKAQGVSEQDMMTNVVQPWIDSMGTWQDSNKNAMEALIGNMTDQIYQGTYQDNFKARSGDSPFKGKARGGSVQHYDDGGSVWDSGIGDDDVTISSDDYSGGGDFTLDPSLFDSLDLSPSYSMPNVDPYQYDNAALSGLSPIGVDNINELSSVQNAVSPSLLSQLANLSTGSKIGLGAAGIGGILAALGASPNMTANYNPTPPKMFNNTGPIAAGQSQYGNFTPQPRQALNPTVNYAQGAENPGGVPMYFANQNTAPSPLATGAAASASPVTPQSNPSSPVASGPSSASPLNAVLQQAIQQAATQQQIQPAPIQYAQQLQQMYPGSGAFTSQLYGAAPRSNNQRVMLKAGGGMVGHSDGMSPLQMGMGLAAGTHVRGPGDGTSDDIPAMLSDGEYVIPAHIVSALGNGSNDAGAKALDAFQDNVRRDYGQQMGAGKHPRRMKDPGKYIK